MSATIPGRDVPAVDVPAAVIMRQVVQRGGDARARQDRQDDVGLAEDLVDLDQQRGALGRVELLLGGLVGLVGSRVGVARDVAAQPLVLLVGDLPETNWLRKRSGSGCGCVVVYISMSQYSLV
jgi:hypothetical protein